MNTLALAGGFVTNVPPGKYEYVLSIKQGIPTADSLERFRQKEKRAAEEELVGWHHQFNGHELGRTPGDGEGQGGLVCCSPWGHKESDTT